MWIRRASSLLALLIAAFAASVGTAAGAPVWEIDAAHGPEHLPPGGKGQYVIQAFNKGDSVTQGPVALTAALPDGVNATLAYGFNAFGLMWDCSSTSFPASVITCGLTGGDVEPPGPFMVPGGAAPALYIDVEVDPGAEGSIGDSVVTIEGGGAESASAVDATRITSTPAGFGITAGSAYSDAFKGPAASADPERQAGAHPYEMRVGFRLNLTLSEIEGSTAFTEPAERMRTLKTRLPRGFYGIPTAMPLCNTADLANGGPQNRGFCPTATQVGYIDLRLNSNDQVVDAGLMSRLPVFNMRPRPGVIASLGFSILSFPTYIEITLDPEDHSLVATIRYANGLLPARRANLVLWGVPSDPAHDHIRIERATGLYGAPSGTPVRPYLTLPSQCDVNWRTELSVSSWMNPDRVVSDATPGVKMTGCEDVRFRFQPQLSIRPEVKSPSTPTGLEVDLAVPQKDDSTTDQAELYADGGSTKAIPTPPLKDVEVVLPKGMSISSASASGLESCTSAQIRLGEDGAPSCPASSKLGSLELETPLLDNPVGGSIYLAAQDENPFGSLIALYVVIEDRDRGMFIKLPGKVEPDSETGQLIVTFDENPPLPLSRLKLRFKGGQRAALVTPPTCGTHTTEATLTSWNSAIPPVRAISSFQITGNCDRGFAPDFGAGSVDPTAAASSTFAVMVRRGNDDRELASIRRIQLPEGLLGRVGSVPLCGADLADRGACPEASQIGRLEVAAGAGAAPLWIPQAGRQPTRVYLAGPYRGAPYSLSIVAPAHAGPFNLGRVVVRSALHVDERTTRLTTGIDQARVFGRDGSLGRVIEGAMPTILEGIPLNLRELRVLIDREGFMVNPTDCSQKQVAAQVVSVAGDAASRSSRFRAAECARLGFAPRFHAKILDKGRKSTLRSFHPRIRFTVAPRRGDANIGGARVVLPSSTLLDQANIGTTCTRAQMAERICPEASIVGYARAWSPLLRKALEGPVYLAANGGVRPLPDLVAVMDGEIRVVLQGEIATRRGKGKARLQNTFRIVPDAPVSRFVLTMRGGAKRGLLVNSTDLCRSRERGLAVFTGQNGHLHKLRPRIGTSFKGCGKLRRRAARYAQLGGNFKTSVVAGGAEPGVVRP